MAYFIIGGVGLVVVAVVVVACLYEWWMGDDGYEDVRMVRAGGSKGPADLVAIFGWRQAPLVHLVQCKLNGYLLPAELRSLVDLSTRLHARPVVAYWAKDGRAARTVAFKEA